MTEALNPELVMNLRVQSAAWVARDIRQFELVAEDGSALPEFTPGAHLLIQAPTGVTRRYSITNPPDEREHYVIAVKRDANGRGGSSSIVDGVNVGDKVHVSIPRNEFELKANAPSYVFIAGGIGITPIRSMIRHLMSTGEKPFKLYYLTREPELTAFRDEFGQPEYRGKVVLHHDYGDPEKAFDLWPMLEKPKGAHIYCCGPAPLMDAVRDMTGHWSTSAVHFEDFGAGKTAPTGEDKPLVVRLGVEGEAIEVPANMSILEALRAKGHRVPSSCESGTCGSCRMKVLAGEPDHRDLVLSENERRHEIIVCVSRAHSAELALAF
jgi:phthalate 4,5-dioxygenase reductase subunit